MDGASVTEVNNSNNKTARNRAANYRNTAELKYYTQFGCVSVRCGLVHITTKKVRCKCSENTYTHTHATLRSAWMSHNMYMYRRAIMMQYIEFGLFGVQ